MKHAANVETPLKWRCDFYYPNVTTLRSDLCYRKSVCRLSVVCL